MENAEMLHVGPAVTKARGEQGSSGLWVAQPAD